MFSGGSPVRQPPRARRLLFFAWVLPEQGWRSSGDRSLGEKEAGALRLGHRNSVCPLLVHIRSGFTIPFTLARACPYRYQRPLMAGLGNRTHAVVASSFLTRVRAGARY